MRASTNHRLLNNICPIEVIVFPFNKLTFSFSQRIHVIHNKTSALHAWRNIKKLFRQNIGVIPNNAVAWDDSKIIATKNRYGQRR